MSEVVNIDSSLELENMRQLVKQLESQISSLKNAQNKSMQLAEFLLHSTDVYIELDANLNIVFVSDSFTQIIEQFERMDSSYEIQLSKQLNYEFIQKGLRRVKNRKKVNIKLVGSDFNNMVQLIRIKTPSATVILDAKVSEIVGVDNHIIKYQIVARDITMWYELYQNNLLLSELHDTSPVMHTVVDLQTEEIIFSNKLFKENAQVEDGEKVMVQDVHTKSEYDLMMTKMPEFFEKKIGSVERTVSYPNGINRTVPLLTHSKLINSFDGRTLMVSACYDLTIQKELEQKIYQQEEERKNNQKQLDRILRLSLASEVSSGIAHQINQPLAVVSSKLQLWDSFIKKNDTNWIVGLKKELPEIVTMLDEVGSAVHKVKNLLHHNPNNNLISIDLIPLCEKIMENYKVQYPKKEFHLHVDNEQSFSKTVTFDKQLLTMSINNILNNSIEATEAQNNVQINMVLTYKEDCLKLHICDNGPGVCKRLHHKIFEPFYSTKIDGTGIGLSLLKSMSEYYGMEIYYDDDFKHENFIRTGAAFCIVFPIT